MDIPSITTGQKMLDSSLKSSPGGIFDHGFIKAELAMEYPLEN